MKIGELVPQATFCAQVVNHGILGHYVATASLATGVYETFDNFANVAPDHPTVFEYLVHQFQPIINVRFHCDGAR